MQSFKPFTVLLVRVGVLDGDSLTKNLYCYKIYLGYLSNTAHVRKQYKIPDQIRDGKYAAVRHNNI